MPLKVALVRPSATNDLSWTQTIYAALESLKSSQHLTVSVSANEYVTSDAANILREYASDGYNLIIAHGSQYGSTIEQLAPQFRKVSFAWGTAAATFGKSNIFAFEAAANEGGYVEGYMAAMLSKKHDLGVCGPIATGDDKLYIDGYVAGAKAESKSIMVHAVYTGSYSDDSLMATCAKTFVADRVDVLSATTQSAVGAIGVARTDKLPWFGNDWSMASLAPQNVVATQVYNWDSVLDADVHGDPRRHARRRDLRDRARQRRGEDRLQPGLQALPHGQGRRREADHRDNRRRTSPCPSSRLKRRETGRGRPLVVPVVPDLTTFSGGA